MVRRWADQANSWSRVTRSGNNLVYLMAGKLTAFAGFSALGDFNLQFICVS